MTATTTTTTTATTKTRNTTLQAKHDPLVANPNRHRGNAPSRATPQLRYCEWCQETPSKLYCCARCFKAWYCGKECQIKAWKDHHKRECCLCDDDEVTGATTLPLPLLRDNLQAALQSRAEQRTRMSRMDRFLRRTRTTTSDANTSVRPGVPASNPNRDGRETKSRDITHGSSRALATFRPKREWEAYMLSIVAQQQQTRSLRQQQYHAPQRQSLAAVRNEKRLVARNQERGHQNQGQGCRHQNAAVHQHQAGKRRAKWS